jgi:outer membrane protein assembly factor BamB
MQHHPWLRLPSCFCLILVLLCPCLASALSGCVPPCEASAPSSGESDLLATGGLIYMEAPSAGTLYLYALHANTGAVQWRFPAAGVASLAVDAGIVYLDVDGIFYALNASDGHILWHHAITYPDVAYEGNAALYIYQTQSSTLIALNGSDGTQRWSARIPALITIDTKEGIPEYGYEHMQSIDGVLYLVSYQGVISALREDSGTLLWQTSAAAAPLPSSNLFGAAPLSLSHGLLYVFTDQLYALRASDGKLLWQTQHTFGPDLELLNGVLYNGRLHVPRQYAFDGLVYALSASNGHVLWQYQTHLVSDPLLSLLPFGPLILLFQRDPNRKMLVALQANDGKVLWQHSTQAANVILADGSLYASYSGYEGTSCYAARDSQLEKIQPDTGTRLWRFQLAA